MTTIVNGTTGLTFPDGVTQSSGIAAPGASGNVLTSNGTTWTSAAPAGGFGNMSVGTYTAASNSSGSPMVWNSNGSLTFTVPTGITKVKVTVVGGGGGGGGGNSCSSHVGAGGGGGGTAIEIISGLTPGATISVTVGAGGTGSAELSAGTAGGTSSFGAYCSASGGAGGPADSSPPWIGFGGVGSGGQLNIGGGDGAPSGIGTAGTGGSSFMGGSATNQYNNSSQNAPGKAYGGGGAGGTPAGQPTYGRGPGASGVVIVEY